MTHRLSHIGICVSELERSLRFYREVLGFRELSDLRVQGPAVDQLLELREAALHAVYLERDGVRIELLHFEQPGHRGPASPRPMNQLGLTHLSFRVQDLGELLARALDAGAPVLTHTRVDNPELGASAVFITDPDGTRIELVQAPRDLEGLPGA